MTGATALSRDRAQPWRRPPSTGKTHIGLAPGLAAFQEDQSVAFTTAADLVHSGPDVE